MREKLFLDTNVVLDLLGERELFYESAAKIASIADRGKVKLIVSPTATGLFQLKIGRLAAPRIVVSTVTAPGGAITLPLYVILAAVKSSIICKL